MTVFKPYPARSDRRFRRHAAAFSVAVVLTGLTALNGCSTAGTDTDWKSLDMCGLYHKEDLEFISAEPDRLVGKRTDSDIGIGCGYADSSTRDRLAVFLKERDSDLTGLPQAAVKRTFEITGRKAYVTYESGAECELLVQMTGLSLGMSFSMDSVKRTPDMKNPGTLGCTFYLPMVEQVISRTGLS